MGPQASGLDGMALLGLLIGLGAIVAAAFLAGAAWKTWRHARLQRAHARHADECFLPRLTEDESVPGPPPTAPDRDTHPPLVAPTPVRGRTRTQAALALLAQLSGFGDGPSTQRRPRARQKGVQAGPGPLTGQGLSGPTAPASRLTALPARRVSEASARRRCRR